MAIQTDGNTERLTSATSEKKKVLNIPIAK